MSGAYWRSIAMAGKGFLGSLDVGITFYSHYKYRKKSVYSTVKSGVK